MRSAALASILVLLAECSPLVWPPTSAIFSLKSGQLEERLDRFVSELTVVSGPARNPSVAGVSLTWAAAAFASTGLLNWISSCLSSGTSRDFDLDAGGALDIYYRGQHTGGTWSAAASSSPFVFTTAAGRRLNLPNGLVWVDVVGN